MAGEQAKTAPAPQEHPFPPAPPYPHQHFNGGTYPPPGPPGAYPPYFAYPPPPDGNHGDANGPNGGPPGPYMVAYPPPGMVYAYPPPGQGFPVQQGPPAPQALTRPKRKQVKMACTNCAAACKRCDEARPCERCLKYGVAETCVDGQRKERKKGIKRGPYKRKNKTSADPSSFGEYPPSGPENEWSHGSQPPTAASTTTAAIHAVAQFTAPEGYYPLYYPPHGGFMPPMPEGPPPPEGTAPHTGQPILPYYIHPAGYPPFPHYPHPGVYPPHGPPAPHTLDPAEATKKSEVPSGGGANGNEDAGAAVVTSKKRSRASKGGEPKVKKVKATTTRSQKGTKVEGENDQAEADTPVNGS